MTVAADWRRLTKVLLGVSLIAAPLLIGIGELISSPVYGGDDYAKYLASIEEHGTAYYAGNVLGALGALFLVGAVVAMIRLVRVRHPKYAIGVGALALLCVIPLSGMWMMSTVAEYQMANSPDQAAMARLLTEGEEAASAIPLMVVWIGMTLAVILLAAGLLWSRTVPRWMPALLIVAFLLLFVGDEGVLGVVTTLAVFAALGGIGITILRSSEDEWEAGDLAGARPPAATAPATVPAH
jgi:preprotein translocase subunit Sec61beta